MTKELVRDEDQLCWRGIILWLEGWQLFVNVLLLQVRVGASIADLLGCDVSLMQSECMRSRLACIAVMRSNMPYCSPLMSCPAAKSSRTPSSSLVTSVKLNPDILAHFDMVAGRHATRQGHGTDSSFKR